MMKTRLAIAVLVTVERRAESLGNHRCIAAAEMFMIGGYCSERTPLT